MKVCRMIWLVLFLGHNQAIPRYHTSSSPSNLPLHILNTDLPARFLVKIIPFTFSQINSREIRRRFQPLCHPFTLIESAFSNSFEDCLEGLEGVGGLHNLGIQ